MAGGYNAAVCRDQMDAEKMGKLAASLPAAAQLLSWVTDLLLSTALCSYAQLLLL